MTPVAMDLTQENIREYQVCHTFDRDFINCLNRLHRQYGDDVFEVLGIANRNLDIARFSEEFFNKATANVADVSVDDNANVSEKNISHYESESTKALQKLNSLATMYLWVKKCFSKKDADVALEKVLNGELFINDSTKWNFPYCFSFDLRNLLYDGMSFFSGGFKILPPKRSESYIALMIQSIAFISNQIAGACMHKDQKIIISDTLQTTSITSQKLYETYSNSSSVSFQYQDSFWDMVDVTSENIQIWENNRFVKLKKVYRRTYSQDIFRLKTVSGKEIRVSQDHVFKIVFRGREIEVKAKDICKYDTVVNTQMLNIPINKEGYQYQLGQMLGIICGDGCLTHDNMLGVSVNNKQGFIADFLDSFFEKNYGKKGARVVDKRGACFNWGLYSKEIQEKVKSLFSSLKADSLLCDSKYIDMEGKSLDFKLGFLDGILVTDGSWNHCFRLGLVNEKLIQTIEDICKEVGIGDIKKNIVPAKGNKKEFYCIAIPNKIRDYLSLTPLRYTNNKKYHKCIRSEVGYVGFSFAKSTAGINAFIYQNGFCSTGDGNLKKAEFPGGLTDVIMSIEKETNNHPYVYEVETETGWYSCGGVLTHNCSFPDFFVGLDYFYRKEYGAKYYENPEYLSQIQNQFQNFIYSVNFPFRGQGQSPFVNLSLMCKGFMKTLFTKEGINGQDYVFPDNTKIDIESTMALSKKFFEYYTKINSTEGIFTFPVMTLAVAKDENGEFVDPDFVDWVCKANAEKCLGNVYVGEATSYSSCCRLKLDLAKSASLGYTNSFGVGGLSIGSHRCAGLNLPRMALKEKENPDLFEENMTVLHNILYSHRQLLKFNIESGTLPLYNTGWINLKRQYSTVGFVGLHEYFINKDMNPLEEKTIQMGISLLKKIEEKLISWQEKEGDIWNCEQIPGESQCVKLARLDSLLGYNPKEFPLYSNQYLPLWEDSSIYDRFKLQGKFDSHTTGGAILHINVQDNKPLSSTQFRALLEQARTSGTVYFAINLAFSECADQHYSIGQQDVCPVCKKPIVNQYTRVVGYLSKVSAWNKTRRTCDYPRRHFYTNGKLAALEGTSEEKTVES